MKQKHRWEIDGGGDRNTGGGWQYISLKAYLLPTLLLVSR
jgi:hypothetical protein